MIVSVINHRSISIFSDSNCIFHRNLNINAGREACIIQWEQDVYIYQMILAVKTGRDKISPYMPGCRIKDEYTVDDTETNRTIHFQLSYLFYCLPCSY